MGEDSVLLASVREGDERSFSQLSQKYASLVSSLVRKFSHEGMTREDIEDLEQEAQMLLYKAAQTYNSESGLTFGLYAGICIRNGFVTIARKRKNESRYVCEELDEVALSVPDTTELVGEKDSASVLMEKIRSVLSEREYQVFKLMILDCKNSCIAKEIGISTKSVENAIFRIKKKLGAMLL